MKTVLGLLFGLLACVTFAANETVLEADFTVAQVIPGGLLVRGNCWAKNRDQVAVRLAFLAGAKNKVEGDRFSADVFEDGTFTFTDTAGASRTVRKYALLKDTGN